MINNKLFEYFYEIFLLSLIRKNRNAIVQVMLKGGISKCQLKGV